jgi:hypothetical protein
MLIYHIKPPIPAQIQPNPAKIQTSLKADNNIVADDNNLERFGFPDNLAACQMKRKLCL